VYEHIDLYLQTVFDVRGRKIYVIRWTN